MTLVDLEEIAKLGKENGAITMVDSTFASSFNQKPIQQGINIVIHSWWVSFEKNIICCSQPLKICYNLYRPFLHYAPVSKHKEMKTRLGWTISYKSLYFVHPSLELVPLFTGMRERSIRRKDTILVCYYSPQTRSKHNLRKQEVNVQEKMFVGEACHVHVKLDGVVTETTVKNNLCSMRANLK